MNKETLQNIWKKTINIQFPVETLRLFFPPFMFSFPYFPNFLGILVLRYYKCNWVGISLVHSWDVAALDDPYKALEQIYDGATHPLLHVDGFQVAVLHYLFVTNL